MKYSSLCGAPDRRRAGAALEWLEGLDEIGLLRSRQSEGEYLVVAIMPALSI
jgi:hypothetical protein